MPPAAAVPTVEFKVNGADVPTAAHGRQRLPAAMPTTLMAFEEHPDVPAGP